MNEQKLNTHEPELTISVPCAAQRLGIGRSLAFRLVREGVIPALRLGKKLRVPVEALNRMITEVSREESR